jgi:hypothetical protein
MTIKGKTFLIAAAIGLLGCASATAEINVGISLGAPAPVYVAPAPVYVSPYPTYYDPHHRNHDYGYWQEQRRGREHQEIRHDMPRR